MELVCEKYKRTMEAEGAYCRHSTEYCKFRSACLINFVSKENRPKEELAEPVLADDSLRNR